MSGGEEMRTNAHGIATLRLPPGGRPERRSRFGRGCDRRRLFQDFPKGGGLALIIALIMVTPASAQRNENPIPNSGGAIIMQKETLPDPLAAGWRGEKVCAVLEESERLRALKCVFPRKGGHDRHFHAAHFGYVLKGGKMRITDKNGTRVVDLKAGDTWMSDGVEWHEVENIGNSASEYIIVEQKDVRE